MKKWSDFIPQGEFLKSEIRSREISQLDVNENIELSQYSVLHCHFSNCKLAFQSKVRLHRLARIYTGGAFAQEFKVIVYMPLIFKTEII